MDSEDERSGRQEEILKQLHPAYCQFPADTSAEFCDRGENSAISSQADGESTTSKDVVKNETHHSTTKGGLPVARLKEAIASISLLVTIMNSQT